MGQDLIDTDATYKLIWLGFPVFLLGTVDKKRNFIHLGLVSVAMKQQRITSSYSKLFAMD